MILAHQLSMVSVTLLTLQPRAQLLVEALQGDVAAVAWHMNRGAALVALSDFLLSPWVGALSDRIGRRPMMLLGPALSLPMKAAAALQPSIGMLLAERVVCDAMRTLGGTTMAYVCMADLYDGEAYTRALAWLGSASGLAMVLAPLVSSGSARLRPRRAFLAAGWLAAAHLAMGTAFLVETREWRRYDGEEASSALAGPSYRPAFGFLRLFVLGPRLRQCVALFGLHSLLEGKLLQDQASVLQLGAGWGLVARARWTSGLGLTLFAGSQLAGPLLRRLGEHSFAALCHVASLAAFLCLREGSFWGGLLLLTVGQCRRSVSTSWTVAEARASGLGKGETIGYIASWRAAIDFLGALLFAAAHRVAGHRKRPYDVLLLPTLATVLAEVLRWRVALAPQRERGQQDAN